MLMMLTVDDQGCYKAISKSLNEFNVQYYMFERNKICLTICISWGDVGGF